MKVGVGTQAPRPLDRIDPNDPSLLVDPDNGHHFRLRYELGGQSIFRGRQVGLLESSLRNESQGKPVGFRRERSQRIFQPSVHLQRPGGQQSETNLFGFREEVCRRPATNFDTSSDLSPCSCRKFLARRTQESGSRQTRHSLLRVPVPWALPIRYQNRSAEGAAPCVSAVTTNRFIWPAPAIVPAANRIGTGGMGNPICSVNTQIGNAT